MNARFFFKALEHGFVNVIIPVQYIDDLLRQTNGRKRQSQRKYQCQDFLHLRYLQKVVVGEGIYQRRE